jgi:hypothetical protein
LASVSKKRNSKFFFQGWLDQTVICRDPVEFKNVQSITVRSLLSSVSIATLDLTGQLVIGPFQKPGIISPSKVLFVLFFFGLLSKLLLVAVFFISCKDYSGCSSNPVHGG